MRTIYPLSPSLIAKIAAGEVIERPAYAVKELIDNSIDAGAEDIEVRLEDSGFKKIIVHDNGRGMCEEDLLESYKLHTTSKISTEEHLHNISSLGFRGEALASIASVSNVIIESRTREIKLGNSIEIRNGKMIKKSSVGMPVGTTIVVSNLFSPVPARKKFLRSKQKELRCIMEVIIHQAVAHANVSFSVFHNGRKLLSENKTKNFQQRLYLLFSKQLLESLLTFSIEEPYLKVTGLISSPALDVRTKKQYIYINKRYVYDKGLQRLIKDSYGSLLPTRRKPTFLLYIEMPSELIDVNIHPRKEQVSIAMRDKIDISVRNAINNILSRSAPIARQGSGLFQQKMKTTNSFAGLFLKEHVAPFLLRDREELKMNPVQIHTTFILIQNSEGFNLYDQHAIHERILYEQFRHEFILQNKKIKQHQLEQPIQLDLPFIDVQSLKERQKHFEDLGFHFEVRNNTILLLKVPFLFQERNYLELILELLQMISRKEATSVDVVIDDQTHMMFAYLACRQAVKAGDVLNEEQMTQLVNKLYETENILTCPHGRPTKVSVSIEELYDVFHRS